MSTAPAQVSNALEFEGIIDTVTHANPEKGWGILKLRVELKRYGHLPAVSRRGIVTLVGSIAHIGIGEKVKAAGNLTQHKIYGPQLEVTQINILQPKTESEIANYLSKQVPFIGPKFSMLIVKKFGADTISIIDNTPDRLLEIPGIGEERVAKVKETWGIQKAYRELLLFTTNIGLSAKEFDRIYKIHKEKTVEKIKEDPYRLARDIWGIGFAKADAVARHLGIHELSELRIRAAMEHRLIEAQMEGHCFLYAQELIAHAIEFLEHPDINQAVVSECLQRAVHIGFFKCEKGNCIYTPELSRAEDQVVERLGLLMHTQMPDVLVGDENRQRVLKAAANGSTVQLDQTQCEAIYRTLTSKVSVITGSPGTGKTTIVKAIVAGYESTGLQITLFAPTGRAAKRMTEVIGRPAGTIHRTLFSIEKLAKTPEYRRNSDSLKITGVVVTDEASMIDIKLLSWLLKWIDPTAILVIVGDKDQLPSVSAGAVLRDLLASSVIPSTQLTHIHRQAAGSAIIVNAHKINQGIMPMWEYCGKNHTWPPQGNMWVMMIDDGPTQTEAALWCVANVCKGMNLDPVRDCAVLAPMKNGGVGVLTLNSRLQLLVNPNPAIWVDRGGGVRWGTGDKVMQMRNDYTLGVLNGDIGIITDITKDGDRLTEIVVDFDGTSITYEESGQWNAIQLAYASTIHKYQGAESPIVVICLHNSHFMMLQRNLLYTGVTRGKQLVVLIASGSALSRAISNNVVERRNTLLTEKLMTRLG